MPQCFPILDFNTNTKLPIVRFRSTLDKALFNYPFILNVNFNFECKDSRTSTSSILKSILLLVQENLVCPHSDRSEVLKLAMPQKAHVFKCCIERVILLISESNVKARKLHLFNQNEDSFKQHFKWKPSKLLKHTQLSAL